MVYAKVAMRCYALHHEVSGRDCNRYATTNMNVTGCVPRLLLTRRLGMTEQDNAPVARGVIMGMIMSVLVCTSTNPKGVSYPDMTIMRRKGDVAVQAARNHEGRDQEPGQTEAYLGTHACRGSVGLGEVKL